MNKTIEAFVRNQILEKIKTLNDSHIMLFKRMYSHGDLEKSIDDVVKDMPAEKLDWALTQVENTIGRKKV